MSDRSQSDVIGVVLLTLVISLSVTATGAVTVNEWQSDLGGDPIVDIESDLDVDRVELEHFGGDTLNASETVVLLNNNEVAIPLREFEGVDGQFAGGMRISNDEFEPVAGDVSLRVVHEPSQTVVHSESYGLQFLLLVEGEPGPAFMFEEPPINYTLSGEAELTVSDSTVIDLNESNSTITGAELGETTLTADNGEKTQTIDLSVIEPGVLGIETIDTNSTAPDTIELTSELTDLEPIDETDLFIRYRQRQPVAFNENSTNNSDRIIAHGDFKYDPDGYAHADNWVHDNTPLVPGSNRSYTYYAPNKPDYIGTSLRDEPELTETRDRDEFEIDGLDGDFYFLSKNGNNVPVNEPFNVTVEYTEDGKTVNVYVEGKLEQTWDESYNIGDYEELYFTTGGSRDDLRLLSTRANGGSQTAPSSTILGEPQYERVTRSVESLRVDTSLFRGAQPDSVYAVEAHTEREITNGVVNATGGPMAVRTGKLVETRGPTAVGAESVGLEGELLDSLGDTDLSFVVERPDGTEVANTTVATGVDSPRTYSTTVDGLEPNSSYVYYARAEETSRAGPRISDVGKRVPFTTDEAAIETLEVTATGPSSIEVDGNLTNIAGLEEMDRYIRYRPRQPIPFADGRRNNSDRVISHGEFKTGPDGYAHADYWVHDNTPLVPGSNRTYQYYAVTDPDYILATLRDEPELTETVDFDRFQIDDLDGDVYRLSEDGINIPTNEPFNITAEYTDDAETINVYLEGQHVQTWDESDGIGDYEELYFSTWGDRGVRLLSTRPFGSKDTVLPASKLGSRQAAFTRTTDSATTFTDTVSGLQPDTTYFVDTYAEAEVDGQIINATGGPLAVRTEKLVETRRATAIGAEKVDLEGELLDSLGDTDLSFVVEKPDGTVVKNTTVREGVDSERTFSTTVDGLEPNTSYVYYARAEESGGTAQITGTGEKVTFTTDEPALETLEVTATGPSSIEVDGELTNIARLEEMDRSVRYRQLRPLAFNEDPTDNGDEIITGGSFEFDPDGYGHNDDWLHDNTPLVPGSNRTYEYYAPNKPDYIHATLREEPELVETEQTDELGIDELRGDYYPLSRGDNIPIGEPFNVTVEYTEDGETVNVYVEGGLEQTWGESDNISDYDELYFSTLGNNGLRLLSTRPFGSTDTVLPASTLGSRQVGVTETTDSATTFTDTVSGLQPDTIYFVETYAEEEVGGRTINTTGGSLAVRTEKLVETRGATAIGAEKVDIGVELLNSLGDTDLSIVVERPDGTEVANTTVATGVDNTRTYSTTVDGLEPNSSYVYYARAEESGGTVPVTDTGEEMTFTTDEPEIETLDVTAPGPSSIEVDGELTNIARLDQMDITIRYRQLEPVPFDEGRRNNSDRVISNGQFEYGPDGYAHADYWVHDNTPLVPGSNRTYQYYASTDQNNVLATLRDEPELTETREFEAFAIDELDDGYYFIDSADNIPTNEPFNVTVEYTEDGETVNVYVEGQHVQTWNDANHEIGDYEELYFSTWEAQYDLRLLSTRALGSTDTVLPASKLSARRTEFVETTTTSTSFIHEIAGLQPNTTYFVETYAEAKVGDQTINATGGPRAVRTPE